MQMLKFRGFFSEFGEVKEHVVNYPRPFHRWITWLWICYLSGFHTKQAVDDLLEAGNGQQPRVLDFAGAQVSCVYI